MVVVGLTGSIGMGKSVAAAMLRGMDVPVHDADAAVHMLLGDDRDVIAAVAEAFPGTVIDGKVDRGRLGAVVFGDDRALRRLEAILHPRVAESEARFREACARDGQSLAVLEIPLLYETGAESRVDAVMVVSAPADQQRERVLERPGMTPARLDAILGCQMPDAEKRRRAEHLVDTGKGERYTLESLTRIVAEIRARAVDETRHAAPET